MSSSYNTPCSKHKLVVSIYSNIETSLAMSGLVFSVAPPPDGATENVGVENAIRSKMQGWKMREWKNREQIAGVSHGIFSDGFPRVIAPAFSTPAFSTPVSCSRTNHLQIFCCNYSHISFAFVGFVMTSIIPATLKILI